MAAEETIMQMGEKAKPYEVKNKKDYLIMRLRDKLNESQQMLDEYEDENQDLKDRLRTKEYFIKMCDRQLKKSERQNQQLKKIILSMSGNELRHLAPLFLTGNNLEDYDSGYELARIFNSDIMYDRNRKKEKRRAERRRQNMKLLMLDDYGMDGEEYGF